MSKPRITIYPPYVVSCKYTHENIQNLTLDCNFITLFTLAFNLTTFSSYFCHLFSYSLERHNVIILNYFTFKSLLHLL